MDTLPMWLAYLVGLFNSKLGADQVIIDMYSMYV